MDRGGIVFRASHRLILISIQALFCTAIFMEISTYAQPGPGTPPAGVGPCKYAIQLNSDCGLLDATQCAQARTESKIACRAHTTNVQDGIDVAKETGGLDPEDLRAMARIDAALADIVEIRDHSNIRQLESQMQLNQIESDAINPCVSDEKFEQKKSESLDFVRNLKINGDGTVEQNNLKKSLVDELMAKINAEVASISAEYQLSAQERATFAQTLADEAVTSISTLDDLLIKMEAVTRNVSGKCSELPADNAQPEQAAP
jgi:hypothetical protein